MCKIKFIAATKVIHLCDYGFFKIFFNGNTSNIDNYYPTAFLCSYNSFAYIDKANVLKLFQSGKLSEVTSIPTTLEDVRLDYDVLQYKIGLNMYKFYVDGKDY